MFVLKTAFLQSAGAARFGFSTIPLAHFAAAAAQKLDAVHLSTAVTAITTNAPPCITVSLSKGSPETFDAVVLAVPPRATAKLLGDPERYGVKNLDAFDPYPIVDVHFWHDAGSIGFDFAAALESPLQWIFEKEPGYLCCSFSAADEYLILPTVQLEALAWNEVQTFLPTLQSAHLIRSAVTRNPEATYLPRPGTQRPSQQTLHPSVAIAGAWTDTGWPDTMESAIRSGIAAARALLHSGRSSVTTSNNPRTQELSPTA
jgi:predicted NAD/FAD-dependent oxidoreductase